MGGRFCCRRSEYDSYDLLSLSISIWYGCDWNESNLLFENKVWGEETYFERLHRWS